MQMLSEGQQQGGAGATASVKGIICLPAAAVRDSSARCRAHSCQIGSVRCQGGVDELSPDGVTVHACRWPTEPEPEMGESCQGNENE